MLPSVHGSFEPNKPLTSPISLGPRDVLKLQFTLKDGDTPNRPHQAFLLVRDPKTELETFFPLAVKGASGRAKVDLVSCLYPPEPSRTV